MRINILTQTETKTVNFDRFIALAKETIVLLTVDQFQAIMLSGIKNDVNEKTDRAVKLLKQKPFIGFTPAGYLAIYFGKEIPTEILTEGWTWYKYIGFGTHSETKSTMLLTGTNIPFTVPAWNTSVRFLDITLRGVTYPEVLEVTHENIGTRSYGYIYANGVQKKFDLPVGVDIFRSLRMVPNDVKPNAIELVTEKDTRIPGYIRADLGVNYLEAIPAN